MTHARYREHLRFTYGHRSSLFGSNRFQSILCRANWQGLKDKAQYSYILKWLFFLLLFWFKLQFWYNLEGSRHYPRKKCKHSSLNPAAASSDWHRSMNGVGPQPRQNVEKLVDAAFDKLLAISVLIRPTSPVHRDLSGSVSWDRMYLNTRRSFDFASESNESLHQISASVLLKYRMVNFSLWK